MGDYSTLGSLLARLGIVKNHQSKTGGTRQVDSEEHLALRRVKEYADTMRFHRDSYTSCYHNEYNLSFLGRDGVSRAIRGTPLRL